MKKWLSYTLVIIQIVCISILFLTISMNNISDLFYVIVMCGISLGLWALSVMKKSKFQVIPDVRRNAKLVKTGPYKFIRHPMYAAIIVVCFGFLLTDISALRIIIYLLLIIDLFIKLSYEEVLLEKYFPEYKKYKKSTFRLIPFVL